MSSLSECLFLSKPLVRTLLLVFAGIVVMSCVRTYRGVVLVGGLRRIFILGAAPSLSSIFWKINQSSSIAQIRYDSVKVTRLIYEGAH